MTAKFIMKQFDLMNRMASKVSNKSLEEHYFDIVDYEDVNTIADTCDHFCDWLDKTYFN